MAITVAITTHENIGAGNYFEPPWFFALTKKFAASWDETTQTKRSGLYSSRLVTQSSFPLDKGNEGSARPRGNVERLTNISFAALLKFICPAGGSSPVSTGLSALVTACYMNLVGNMFCKQFPNGRQVWLPRPSCCLCMSVHFIAQ